MKKIYSGKISHTFSKKLFLYFRKNIFYVFQVQARKNKQDPAKEKFLYFRKWNFFAPLPLPPKKNYFILTLDKTPLA